MLPLRSLSSARSIALTCPGQGLKLCSFLAQYSKHKPILEKLTQEVDEALGEHFSPKLFDTLSEVNSQVFTRNDLFQPAVVVTTYANYLLLKHLHGLDLMADPRTTVLAGHSLGEYTAHIFAGNLSVGTAVKIARLRGSFLRLLAEDSTEQYTMRAILCKSDNFQFLESYFNDLGVLANINSRTQLTIAGTESHVNKVLEQLRQEKGKGIARAVSVPAAAPFHTEIVRPLEEEIRAAVNKWGIEGSMKKPIISNLTGEMTYDYSTAIENTINVNSRPVQWVKTMDLIVRSGVTDVVHLGPGTLLHDLCTRLDLQITSHTAAL